MRRSLPIVPALVVLMQVTASQAPASLSLVVDLDSNATNGPDTLAVEPTDTVLVRLWFTGSDSIHSYGVTMGDTTGALSWVEEAAATVCNSPAGWTNASIQQDSLAWLLLQATDFTFTTTIQAPYEFARLKFYVTAGDSCGTLEGNLDLSGWFNLDLGEGSFTSFEGPAICVTEVLDGGGDGGGEDVAGGGEGGGLDGGGNECDSLPCCDYVANKPETGRVWVVNDDGTVGVDCDCRHIQACIDSAANGDTVCVNPGTYDTLLSRAYGYDSKMQELYSLTTFCVDKDSIAVIGIAGAVHTIVGRDAGDTAHACVLVGDIADTPDGNRLQGVVIRGFTFTRGLAKDISSGQAFGTGGMLIEYPATRSVLITSNTFAENLGRHGGAMRVHGAPTIASNIFRNNGLAYRHGGTAQRGGGIFVYEWRKAPLIENNTFVENGCAPTDTVRGPGGAICIEGSPATMRGNLFYSNWATAGGGIYLTNLHCDVTIEFNVFARCSVDVSGGGIGTVGDSTVMSMSIRNNTFMGNSASTFLGGAFHSENEGLHLGFVRNIVQCSEGGGVIVGDEKISIDSFGCNSFFANLDTDYYGIDLSDITDTLLVDVNPLLCNPNPCSLYALHSNSPCAAGEACAAVIGARGVCENCADVISECDVSIPTGVSCESNLELARPFGLEVFPNPFNATIDIRFRAWGALPWIDLSVNDIRGRTIRKFPRASTGHRRWIWDGRDDGGKELASGVYFVVARGGGERHSKKIVIVR